MNADVNGALRHINNGGTGWKAFEHRGKTMGKAEVVAILEYAQSKGYKTTAELSDEEVDQVLEKPHPPVE